MIRIGLYSSDTKLQLLLASALGEGYEVAMQATESALHRAYSSGACDVVVLDLDTNDSALQDRIATSRQIIAAQVPSLVMADDGVRGTAVELVRMGAQGYCRKPPSIRDLKAMLRRAYDNSALKRKLQTVQDQLEAVTRCDRMIGSSPQMRQVYDLVRRVADLSAPVLVTGESGTGKELIASAIHNLGSRCGRPYVAVSCGAIPETLIEAELFGHEKGAYTGSTAAREGYLERAGDGTLFLDEIGELSLNTQVKLLRVLQQREFSRLGSTRIIPLRARVIFATHRDLAEMVAQGTFRQDLYYRINVVRIEAPALQERCHDIDVLAMHFLRQYSEMYNATVETIHPDALTLLRSYAWPGNVRELENVIQRAIIVAKSENICPGDLPEDIQESSNVISIEDFQPAGSFERQLRDYKVKLAENAVRDNNGNKTMAARSLNISRAYLHRLIRLSEQPHQMGTA
ncbi:MAG TPA: sigma-54 dependent transcriptional regulator [Acidobacteriaceae bacterium]